MSNLLLSAALPFSSVILLRSVPMWHFAPSCHSGGCRDSGYSQLDSRVVSKIGLHRPPGFPRLHPSTTFTLRWLDLAFASRFLSNFSISLEVWNLGFPRIPESRFSRPHPFFGVPRISELRLYDLPISGAPSGWQFICWYSGLQLRLLRTPWRCSISLD
jgi:hypothetical protein